MSKPANCFIFLILILLGSCRLKTVSEKQETGYWNGAFIDSSFSLLYEYEDTTKALHYFDSSVKRFRDVSVYAKACRFYLKANYFYFFTDRNESTAAMIDSALAMYPTATLQDQYPRACVTLLIFAGHVAYRTGNYNKANEYFYRAKVLGDKYLTPCERAPFSYNTAMVLYRQQNFRSSLEQFREAYELQENCNQDFRAVLQQQEIQSNMGLCYVELKQYDSAMVYFDNALRIANANKDTLGKVFMDRINGVVYGNRAKVLMARGQLQEAAQLCLKGIALNDREGYEVQFAQEVKLQLAQIYHRQQNFAAMFRVLEGMRQKMDRAPAGQQKEWKRLMALYHEKSGNADSALIYLKSYAALSDSIAAAQTKLTAADVGQQVRDKEQHFQISSLIRDKDLAVASLWLTVLFCLMTLAIVYLVYQLYRRSKNNVNMLQSLNEEINRQKAAREEEAKQRHKLITEAVIRAQENERSLIGLELHDNVNQVLTTVKLHNEMVLEGVGEPHAILPRTVKYLQECINEIRSLSKRLSAPTLGKISLEESVRDLIESINTTSKIKITHSVVGLGHILRKEVHLGIYRILQEQLHNVLKHADASEVFVYLERHGEAIMLTVHDDGKGFSIDNAGSGIGLVNMQTRAESLNGTFVLESQPGCGCRLQVSIPCAV